MFSEVWNFIVLFAVLSCGAWALSEASPQDPVIRSWVCWLVIGINSVYAVWRWTATLPPSWAPDTWLAWAYLLIETVALVESGIFWLSMSRTRERPTAAPAPAAAHSALQEAGSLPKVEIWIPTYREPLEVLEKAVLAAKAVVHPGLRVKVLDDGNRDWLQAQCATWQVEYVTRPEHKHAKAGNLNYSLALTDADFIVTMDADFAPYKHFVARTLPFFDNPRLAVLQTPQTFYNPDLAQQNLGLGSGISDEQALFFREIQPARDAWDSAFYCGSCAMLRVAAIRDIGGFPTESITEDLLTTLKLLGKGWQTRFLNEALSIGLAAESIEAFFVQRDRWSRGAVEILFLPEGPVRNAKLTWMQRLLFLPLYWLINPFFNLAIMLAPAICLLTGMQVMIIDDVVDVYMLVLPTVMLNLFTLTWISRGRFSPIISTAVSMVMAVRMAFSAVSGITGQGSKVFKVTPKGSQISASSDRLSFNLLMALPLLTLCAIVYGGWVGQRAGPQDHAQGWIIFLGAFNLVHFLIAMVLVEDRPRLRSEERFRIDAPLPLRLMDPSAGTTDHAMVQPIQPVQVVDMSVNGVRFIWPDSAALPENMALVIGGVEVALELQRVHPQAGGQSVVARLVNTQAQQREALIQFLFSGQFAPVVQGAPNYSQALKNTAKAVLNTP